VEVAISFTIENSFHYLKEHAKVCSFFCLQNVANKNKDNLLEALCKKLYFCSKIHDMTFPENFVERTRALLGEEYPALEAALNENAPTSIRVNNKIDYTPENATQVEWCEEAYYLPERPLFTADPLFHGGAYYVQEASSMFLKQAVKQFFPDAKTVLDLCAAPGGKSTLLAQNLADDCLLVSNEVIRSRAYILAENIVKWGNSNVFVTNNEAADFGKITHFFDAIVVDAPCSGEGMFRKDAGAVSEWSVGNVHKCVDRQREILQNVWEALKPGGILVYSTCTFNREENEENVNWISEELGATIQKPDLHENTKITETDGGYRFYPHKTKGEGFFISVLRKDESDSFFKNTKPNNTKGIKFVKQNEIPYHLTNHLDWLFVNDNNFVRAYQKLFFEHFMFLSKYLHFLETGLLIGEYKGKDLIPATNLALSKALDIESLQQAELDYDTAISYLKKEAIMIDSAEKGYVLVRYKQLSLGWVKSLGNRCNNLYPANWRIRMNL